jgi:D-2-hydroxyacid dehydrogenase (NADP+)
VRPGPRPRPRPRPPIIDSLTKRLVEISVHIGPAPAPSVLEAVTAAGGVPAPLDDAQAVIWLAPGPDGLPRLPETVRWVQLPGAGADRWLERIRDAPQVTFTSATGVYARPVAEHALALLLAGVHRLPEASRARTWERRLGGTLEGATVGVIGAGGIGSALVGLLRPHGAEVIAVTRSGREVNGATLNLAANRLGEVWPVADHIVLTAPATTETRGLIGRAELRAMKDDAWLVNVARGSLIDTEALVEALDAGAIAGAALDVTDPEPLPDGHPLLTHPRALITAHVATAPAPQSKHFAARVSENLRRFAAGEALLSPIDLEAGY